MIQVQAMLRKIVQNVILSEFTDILQLPFYAISFLNPSISILTHSASSPLVDQAPAANTMSSTDWAHPPKNLQYSAIIFLLLTIACNCMQFHAKYQCRKFLHHPDVDFEFNSNCFNTNKAVKN